MDYYYHYITIICRTFILFSISGIEPEAIDGKSTMLPLHHIEYIIMSIIKKRVCTEYLKL